MGRATVVTVAKRDADDTPSNADCVIYRYGSFCTGIKVFGEPPFARDLFSNMPNENNENLSGDCRWPLAFVFRGHWKSRDRTDGQCCDDNTGDEQKCFGYHCYMSGKVNPAALHFIKVFFKSMLLFILTHWGLFFLQPSKRGVQRDSGCRVLEADSLGMQHGGALQRVPAGVASLLQWLWCLLHQRVHGQRRQFSRHQCQSQRGHRYATSPPYSSPVGVCFIPLTEGVLLVSGSALYSPGTIGMVLGVLVLVLAIGIVAYSYR